MFESALEMSVTIDITSLFLMGKMRGLLEEAP